MLLVGLVWNTKTIYYNNEIKVAYNNNRSNEYGYGFMYIMYMNVCNVRYVWIKKKKKRNQWIKWKK